jgi:hypothetical protein
MTIDFNAASHYDMDSLRQDIENRKKSIESLQWAINEHLDQIKELEIIIAWKRENDNKNGSNS